MKNWRVTCIIVAMAVVAIVFAALYGNAVRETSSAPLKTVAATNVGEQLPGSLPSAELPDVDGLSLRERNHSLDPMKCTDFVASNG